jgi:phosphoglycolate phosphatase-like HAD superfamily hydrolase
LDELAHTYEAALEDSLELKCGALSLLTHIKAMGKKIVVITEGPQDAQEKTLEKLGLKDKIDFLATTNLFRVSKVDGLFSKVLEQLKIGASDMVYVGDSKQRYDTCNSSRHLCDPLRRSREFLLRLVSCKNQHIKKDGAHFNYSMKRGGLSLSM